MTSVRPSFFTDENDCSCGHDSEITCRCGKEFRDLEDLIISLDDAGLTFYCDRCPENILKVNRNQFDIPYV